MEKKEKKLTASQVCKNYGLTPDELDKLLEQIFNELEKTEEDEEGTYIGRQVLAGLCL